MISLFRGAFLFYSVVNYYEVKSGMCIESVVSKEVDINQCYVIIFTVPPACFLHTHIRHKERRQCR